MLCALAKALTLLWHLADLGIYGFEVGWDVFSIRIRFLGDFYNGREVQNNSQLSNKIRDYKHKGKSKNKITK